MNEIKNQCYYPQNLLLCKQTPSVVWYNPPTIMDFQSALRLFHNRCLRKSVRWDFVVGAWGLMPLALYHGITPGISLNSICPGILTSLSSSRFLGFPTSNRNTGFPKSVMP